MSDRSKKNECLLESQLDIDSLLNRENEVAKMKDILTQFNINIKDPLYKKGIYVYGEPGTGKTTFVMKILREMNYDIVRYDAGDIRNKSIIDNITTHNMSDKNVMSMFHKKVKKIAIVMDEIDGMNNGDKGGLNALIKIIRPKKTKKQRLEDITHNPIICIGNNHIDKKIKELMKVCYIVELKTPVKQQIQNIVQELIPNYDEEIKQNISYFVQNDLRKLNLFYNIYKNKPEILSTNPLFQHIFQTKSFNDDTKMITQKLINHSYSINDHLSIMNETDRTIVGLLWHENIIDVLGKMKKSFSVPFYVQILNNICFADYIDRITFQKQIWQFNEMSSLIKTFKNHKLYNETLEKISKKKPKYNPTEVRFTKILTKYSTEYNNNLFIQNLCQQLSMDKKDLFSFFLHIKNRFYENDIMNMFGENYEISKLDINRIYRYLNKYTNIIDSDVVEDDENICENEEDD